MFDAAARTRLSDVATAALAEARKLGASAAETAANVSQGLSINVRLGEVETLEQTRDKGLSITVYFGQRTGSASTTDLSPTAVRDTVRAACTIARYTAEDDCAGLADADRLARTIPDLDLLHPWHPGADRAIELARECEDAARAADARITNSEGASISTSEGLEVYANSTGFIGSLAGTRHSLSCAVIAQDASGMQRDYWYTVSRRSSDLEEPVSVGQRAASRAVKRLAARKLATCRAPVLYDAPVAASLLSHFIGAIRGESLYRGASFLVDHLGKPVFASHVHLHEQPHLRGALGSTPFDNEGVATAPRDIVRDGIVQGYVLDSYSGRKLKMPTTGNAGGVHNLTIDSGKLGFQELLKQMGTGLFVTELIGFGVNLLTGDYSRGAAGFWVENGEIAYPVEEITIAGNLRDMYRNLVAVGTDVDVRGNVRTGSILLDAVTIAGS
ncbi:MAG: metalloprotease PmbA [Gammaproteobacteria bacterium]|nr:metalloprotease PmbA [Gammaproteobacteria bacterium]